ncbi:hypothetical protein Bca4012_003589 [Brassica carinata]|uniref:Uncharacterized protein n=4 Tax=Brassica TaxID=3705 RepID=A0A0D3B9H8_BRAOL|nr:PREDICTED: uncharacterized protein LOC106332805 [Brassica oleracea var. oleracea]XP_013745018.1 uncharacterized protein BNAC03G33270D [Brassica napus]KAG2295217.1 hypothetical protein Bca52824_041886 [Brassica carinata]VDC92374.1 unnamed protein product [Brassica oleracea]KAH0890855.1 hypothetical protein HID58_053284 [Brassica napus]CAF1703233.1 unnamed protein product [Brassica napus]
MSSSKASYMFVALILLVLVLADMDKALGEQIQLRNRKLSRLIPKGWFSANQKKLPAWMKKGQDLMGAIPPPPPSPLCNINDDVCKRKLKKAYDLLKAKSPPSP